MTIRGCLTDFAVFALIITVIVLVPVIVVMLAEAVQRILQPMPPR